MERRVVWRLSLTVAGLAVLAASSVPAYRLLRPDPAPLVPLAGLDGARACYVVRSGVVPVCQELPSAAAALGLAHVLDALPQAPSGAYSCASDSGRRVELTLRYTGHPQVQVVAALSGCSSVGSSDVGVRSRVLLPSAARAVLLAAGQPT